MMSRSTSDKLSLQANSASDFSQNSVNKQEVRSLPRSITYREGEGKGGREGEGKGGREGGGGREEERKEGEEEEGGNKEGR